MNDKSFDVWKKLYMKEIDNSIAAEEANKILNKGKTDNIRIVTIKGKTYRIDNNYKPAKIEELLDDNR